LGALVTFYDVYGDPRRDVRAALERCRGLGRVVDEPEHTERLGRPFVDTAIGLAGGERVVDAVLDLGLHAPGNRHHQRDRTDRRAQESLHARDG